MVKFAYCMLIRNKENGELEAVGQNEDRGFLRPLKHNDDFQVALHHVWFDGTYRKEDGMDYFLLQEYPNCVRSNFFGLLPGMGVRIPVKSDH